MSITNHAQMLRNQTSISFGSLQFYLFLVVAGAEAFAWAHFGSDWVSKGFFIAWAIGMVWLRPTLASARTEALQRGDDSTAAGASLGMWLAIIISGLSLFMLYWEAIDSYKQGKIAEAALVVSAEKSLNTEEATLEQLK
ncbi:MAG: hypothetical protein AAF512_01870, partial [Pseudomonadota bacterium]